MRKDSSIRSFVFFSQAGCLLPLLIIFNLCFGWLFFKPMSWLLSEAILILLFVLTSFITAKKIISASGKRQGAIDVEGEVIDDNKNNDRKNVVYKHR